MILLKPSSITSELINTGQNGMPIIVCTDVPRVKKKLDEAGYKEVQINKELSKMLLGFAQEDRPKKVQDSLNVLINLNTPIYITNFEMLFDPRYKLDVIKYFCEKSRINNIAVKWPGKYNDGKLTYANPEDLDYQEYNCNTYQIQIVQ